MFLSLRDRAVTTIRGFTQPAWDPVSLPSSVHNNVFSQKIPKSLSPSAPACNHIKVPSFSLQHEQRIPAPGRIFPEGGLRAEDVQAQACHPLLNGKQMKQILGRFSLGEKEKLINSDAEFSPALLIRRYHLLKGTCQVSE